MGLSSGSFLCQLHKEIADSWVRTATGLPNKGKEVGSGSAGTVVNQFLAVSLRSGVARFRGAVPKGGGDEGNRVHNGHVEESTTPIRARELNQVQPGRVTHVGRTLLD